MKRKKSLIREKVICIIIARKLLWESVKLKFKEVTGYESKKDKELKKLKKLEQDKTISEFQDVIIREDLSEEAFEEIVKSLKETIKNNDVKGLDEDSDPITAND